MCRGQPQEKDNSADHQREHSKLLGVCGCASMHKRYVHLVYVYIKKDMLLVESQDSLLHNPRPTASSVGEKIASKS